MTASRRLIATVAAIFVLLFGPTYSADARPTQERQVATASLAQSPRDTGACKGHSTKRNSILGGFSGNLHRSEDSPSGKAGGHNRVAASAVIRHFGAFVKPDQFAPRLGSAALTAFPIEPYGYDAAQRVRETPAVVATNTPIGFAPGAADDALSNIGRVDHSARNLLDQGVRQGTSGSKAVRSAFQDGARSILENPAQTFDHVMAQGGQRVKGFVGEINGQKVVVFVAKEARGKVAAGDLVTAIVPSPQQAANWGIR